MGPVLAFASPADQSVNIPISTPVTCSITSLGYTIVTNSISVWLAGKLAISGGLAQSGYATSITGSSTVTVTISAYPIITTNAPVDCVIQATDSNGTTSWMSFSFSIVFGYISNLTAQSWCAGNRIDLAWTNPSGATITNLGILRSKLGYVALNETTPESTIIYDGAPISLFTDGAYSGPNATTNVALEDATFYYYTIYISINSEGDAQYTSPSAQVTGLSIKNYKAKEGTYVYNKFPLWERRADNYIGTVTNTSGVLYMIADIIQCGINLIRGYADGLWKARDPDEMPAGQIGIPYNSMGIILAQMWDLGFPAQPEFDITCLRRVANDLTSQVLKQKGTCPSLVNLISIITGWTARCDELIDPVCGVDRVFRTWGQPSQVFRAQGSITNNVGSVIIDPTNFFLADGATVAAPPDPAAYIGMFIIDDMGTFACIKSWDGVNTYTYDNASATLRGLFNCVGTGALNTFTITAIDTAHYPWQYLSPDAPPKWGQNAWAGSFIKDNTNTVFEVISSAATTAGGSTVLTVVGTPSSGTTSHPVYLSWNGGGPAEAYSFTLYAGRFSLTYDPRWDTRLAQENLEGPWSFIAASQASVQPFGYGATLGDVVLWVDGQASALGNVTSLTYNTLTDATANWTVDQWRGYYINPNQGHYATYRIVKNTETTLVLDASSGSLLLYSGDNAPYAILTAQVNDLFSAMTRILPNYSPTDSSTSIRFE